MDDSDELYSRIKGYLTDCLRSDSIETIQSFLARPLIRIDEFNFNYPDLDNDARFYELICSYGLREMVSNLDEDTTVDLVMPDVSMQDQLRLITKKHSWDGALLLNQLDLLPIECKSTMFDPRGSLPDHVHQVVVDLYSRKQAEIHEQSIFTVFALPYADNISHVVPINFKEICSWLEHNASDDVIYSLQLLEFSDSGRPSLRTIILPHFVEQLPESLESASIVAF